MLRELGRKRTAQAAAALTCAVAVVALGSEAAAAGPAPREGQTTAPIVEKTRWHASADRGSGALIRGNSIGIYIEGGYCSGSPRPEFDHLTVVELPKTAKRSFKAVIVTTFRLWPEVTFTPVAGPSYANKCDRIERKIFRWVRTKRPASELRFFDGYFSPPHQVWPPAGGRLLR